ncbi:hypothetical protein BO83DRAFT_428473 [Aspergillus eucalypticola CBS 122712]|uniref:Uncharacterized protein n=1 Tax=Aspergillus eucalypticola (strain CBS 122712 / IBT 29274) TaxID=1448314 RepID=A0A317V6T5_ASPEC|nr:uncharacterized protein BO83DRAFT_428473 [Aspergillus eucalypticola CBS 122712]PWY70063.1 hypothetical protein BO83DRAFT_428473 [Aspergillus eucalypticola CBS 122712]
MLAPVFPTSSVYGFFDHRDRLSKAGFVGDLHHTPVENWPRQGLTAILGQKDPRLAEQGIMLETYIAGPELDANFVLLNGTVLFLEVTDIFPCSGDDTSATLEARPESAGAGFPVRRVPRRDAHAQFHHAV